MPLKKNKAETAETKKLQKRFGAKRAKRPTAPKPRRKAKKK